MVPVKQQSTSNDVVQISPISDNLPDWHVYYESVYPIEINTDIASDPDPTAVMEFLAGGYKNVTSNISNWYLGSGVADETPKPETKGTARKYDLRARGPILLSRDKLMLRDTTGHRSKRG